MFFVLITKDAPPSSSSSSPLCVRQGHAPYRWQNILKSQLYNDCTQNLSRELTCANSNSQIEFVRDAPCGWHIFFNVSSTVIVDSVFSRELTCANSNSQIEFLRSCSIRLQRILQSHFCNECMLYLQPRADFCEFEFSD